MHIYESSSFISSFQAQFLCLIDNTEFLGNSLFDFFATERHERLLTPGSTFSLPLERTEGIMSNLRFDSSFRQVADSDRQRSEVLASTSFRSDNGNDQNRETVSEGENLSLSLDNAGPVKVNCGGELESEVEDQPNPPKLDEGGDILARIAQGNSSATNSIPTSHGEKTRMENHFEGQT